MRSEFGTEHCTHHPSQVTWYSGILDSLLQSLKIDQNLFGFDTKLSSRESKKFARLILTIFLTYARISLNLTFSASVGDDLRLRRTAAFFRTKKSHNYYYYYYYY